MCRLSFDDHCVLLSGSARSILYITPRIFLRMISFGTFKKKSLTHLIIDEFHERLESVDVLMYFIKNALIVDHGDLHGLLREEEKRSSKVRVHASCTSWFMHSRSQLCLEYMKFPVLRPLSSESIAFFDHTWSH